VEPSSVVSFNTNELLANGLKNNNFNSINLSFPSLTLIHLTA